MKKNVCSDMHGVSVIIAGLSRSPQIRSRARQRSLDRIYTRSPAHELHKCGGTSYSQIIHGWIPGCSEDVDCRHCCPQGRLRASNRHSTHRTTATQLAAQGVRGVHREDEHPVRVLYCLGPGLERERLADRISSTSERATSRSLNKHLAPTLRASTAVCSHKDRCTRARELLPAHPRPRSANSRLLLQRRLSRIRPHRHRRTGARSRPRPNEIEQHVQQPQRRRRNGRQNHHSALCGLGYARSDSVPLLLQELQQPHRLLRDAALPLSVVVEGKMVGPGRRRQPGKACEGKRFQARFP